MWKDQGLRKKERTEVGRRTMDEGRRTKDQRILSSIIPAKFTRLWRAVLPPGRRPYTGQRPSSIGLYQTNITHRTNPTNITILLSANPILLLSQKGIQCFNDDAGNWCVVLWSIGFNSFRKHTGDLNVELFGYIITLIFETFFVHWLSFKYN